MSYYYGQPELLEFRRKNHLPMIGAIVGVRTVCSSSTTVGQLIVGDSPLAAA